MLHILGLLAQKPPWGAWKLPELVTILAQRSSDAGQAKDSTLNPDEESGYKEEAGFLKEEYDFLNVNPIMLI